MTELAKVMRAEITRLARREARGLVAPASRSAAVARRDLAALKRRITDLERELAAVRKASPTSSGAAVNAGPQVIRYSVKGVRAQRGRFGMSANDFGKLLGVSSQTIYNWEQGAARPRPALVQKLAALRGLSKREAVARARALDGHDR
jgi:DNA-binding transcriptional regulator YiaG